MLLMEVMGEVVWGVVVQVSVFTEHFCGRHCAEHFTHTVPVSHESTPNRADMFCVCHFIFKI